MPLAKILVRFFRPVRVTRVVGVHACHLTKELRAFQHYNDSGANRGNARRIREISPRKLNHMQANCYTPQ